MEAFLSNRESREESRALVPLATRPPPSPAGVRPLAPFLAQLIAIAQRLPQTRRRRRAAADEASFAYAAASRPPARTGRALNRSL
jgi:hypothetical protein